MKQTAVRHALRAGALAMLCMAAPATARSEDKAMTLFKIITVKDEIIIGLSAEELGRLGGHDVGAVARALTSKGELTVWQYAVRKAANGDLQEAPLRQVALLANSSLRVEPYATPLAVLPHE
ncbi:MAG: hypothetical protein ABSG76_19375 [Xanthobacteraceae bacterium]